MKRRTGSGIAHQAVSLDSNATQQQQQHHHHHHHHSPISKSERFMERLVEKVKGILESAVQNDDRSRLTILNEFFSNISCRVEDEVLLYLESDHRAESKRSIPSTSSNPPPSEIGSRHHHEHEHDTYDLHEHERDPGTDHELDPDPDHDTEHHDDHEQDQHQDLGINATEHATSYHSIFNDANNDDSNESNDNVGDKFTKDITTTITTSTGTRCLDNKNNSASNSNSDSDSDGDSEVNESHHNSDADGDSDSDTASNSSSLSLDLPPPVSSDILLLSQSTNPLATSTTPAPALVNPPPPLISGTSEANNEFSSSVPTAPDLSLAVSPSSIPLTSSPVVSTSSTPSPPSPNPTIQPNASSIVAASTSSIPPSGAPRTPSTPTAPSPATHTPPIFYASSAPSSTSPSSSSSASSSVSQGMATGTVEGSNSTTTRERVPMMYYYELLAERFATHPTDVTALLQVIVSLWSNPTFPIIFAALFYKWMFRHDVQMKNFNLFIKGANRLFWLDLETINTRFAPIYKLLNNEVLASYSNVHNNNKGSAPLPLSPSPPAMNGSVLSRFLLDFFNVLGRFFFYYQKVSDLPLFIEKAQAIFSSSRNHSEINPYPPLPPNTTNAPNTSNTITNSTNTNTTSDDSSNIVTIASTDISAQNTAPTHKQLAKISAADNLVDCTIRQIKLIKNEYVLVKYIQKCVHFRGLALTDTTQVKLQTLLYDYTSPGGPSYPPRSVRHAATESLDALFPTGKLPRRYIHLFFRLLHPYYATRSIVHWLYSRVKPFLFIFGTSLEEEEEENVFQSIERE